MKNKIIYIASFLTAFIAVTLAIIALNNNYRNIFAFDFQKVQPKIDTSALNQLSTSAEILMLKNYFEHEFRAKIIDSVKANTPVKVDTVYQEVVKDEKLLDSLQQLVNQLNNTKELLAQKEEQIKLSENENKVDKDWIRKTSKLLAEMDPKRAAKVIKNYSDNEARELIYAMKQRKAAEILSLLDPVFVNKITSSQI